jgi:hypothetical protein
MRGGGGFRAVPYVGGGVARVCDNCGNPGRSTFFPGGGAFSHGPCALSQVHGRGNCHVHAKDALTTRADVLPDAGVQVTLHPSVLLIPLATLAGRRDTPRATAPTVSGFVSLR